MSMFNKLWQKLKNIFIKKQELVVLDVSKCDSNQEIKVFKESLKTTVKEVVEKRKNVQSHICYGDGLGIKKKMQY